MNEQNPYESPSAETQGVTSQKVRSRFVWLVVPAVVGLFVGAKTLTWVFGSSPSDPFGETRASGLGGMIVGIIGHVSTRSWRTRRGLKLNTDPFCAGIPSGMHDPDRFETGGVAFGSTGSTTG